MNEKLTEIYKSCRTKEALASQDEYNSANALLGSEVEKFAKLIVDECIKAIEETTIKFVATTYDKSLVDSTKAIAIQSIHNRFK